MIGKVVSIETKRKTPLERARGRVVYALRCAEDGLLDLDTMDSICTALVQALKDLDEVAGSQEPPAPRAA